jgi:hypothetical protein
VAFAHDAQQVWNQRDDRRLECGHLDDAHDLRACCRERGLCAVDLLQDSLGMLDQDLACCGQSHASTYRFDESNAGLGLELTELLADGRGAERQCLRHPRQGAAPAEFHQQTNAVQVEHCPLLSIGFIEHYQAKSIAGPIINWMRRFMQSSSQYSGDSKPSVNQLN